MAGGRSVGCLHSTEFAGFVVVGSVIGIINEIEENGPRPIEVEDLRRLCSEKSVSSVFEVVLIDRMEPVSDSIAAGVSSVWEQISQTDARLTAAR